VTDFCEATMADSSNEDGFKARFDALFGAHHRVILAYCARRCGLWDAWDATSDVFLVAWRRIDEIPAGEEARAWLLGVAARVLANQRRGETRRAKLGQRAGGLAAWSPLPDEPLLRNEEDREVIEALARLRDIDREIILLTLWEELSPVAIAKHLGISRGAVDQRYSRALRRLGREMALASSATRHATQLSAQGGGVA
jgi:RNA polymerase sigma-70 factor (ECF subfamily)